MIFTKNIIPDDRFPRFLILVCDLCYEILKSKYYHRIHSCGHQNGVCYICELETEKNVIYRIDPRFDQHHMNGISEVKREIIIDKILNI